MNDKFFFPQFFVSNLFLTKKKDENIFSLTTIKVLLLTRYNTYIRY